MRAASPRTSKRRSGSRPIMLYRPRVSPLSTDSSTQSPRPASISLSAADTGVSTSAISRCQTTAPRPCASASSAAALPSSAILGLFDDRRVAVQLGAQLVDECFVDRNAGAALCFGGELFDQFVAEGRCERLGDGGNALRLDRLRIGPLNLVQRDNHPAAIARDFERLDAVLRHREQQREFVRNGFAAGAEFGAAPTNRLDAADIGTGRGNRFAEVLAALACLHDRTGLVSCDLLPFGKAPFRQEGRANLREGGRSSSDDGFYRIDGELFILDQHGDMAFAFARRLERLC